MKSALMTGATFLVLIAAFFLASYGGKLPWTASPAHGADWCDKHHVELSKCEKCNPKLMRGGTVVTRLREPKPGECPNTLVKIELGPGVAERIGLAKSTVALRPVAETLRANAETAYLPSAWSRVSPRLAGVLREVPVQFGQGVESGAVLAVLDAPELAGAKSEFLQAASTRDLRQELYDKVKGLFEKRLVTGRDELESRTVLEESRLVVQAAEMRLRGLGLTVEQVGTVLKDRDVSPRLEVRSPVAGTIVSVSAVVGENASPERPLFEVVSLELMWVAIDTAEADLTRIEKGQRAAFFLDAYPGRKFVGKVTAIGGAVDEVTRTVKVYAEVKNPDGLLRAHMFGRVEVTVRPAEPRMLVPRESIQSDGDCALVFVETTPGVFQARKLELGAVYESGFEVKGGLLPGEIVATTGSFLLKTEALKGQMGAG